jgi:hypothetical protein
MRYLRTRPALPLAAAAEPAFVPPQALGDEGPARLEPAEGVGDQAVRGVPRKTTGAQPSAGRLTAQVRSAGLSCRLFEASGMGRSCSSPRNLSERSRYRDDGTVIRHL